MHVAEAAHLLAGAEDGQRLPRQGLPDKPGNDHAVPPGLAPSGIWETVRPPISFPPAAIFRMSGSVSYWDVAQFVVLLGKHTRPEGM